MSARVFLGETLVGQLVPDPAKSATSLEIDRAYALRGTRPVLGRWFEVLRWAARCGLDVPEHRLVRAEEIQRLPVEFEPAQSVLLVRRFDRTPGGARVHQEDFAQVFGVAPEEKYASDHLELDGIHFGSIGDVIHRLCGSDDFLEYMKRLAFMVLSGNDDAHLKIGGWSTRIRCTRASHRCTTWWRP